MAVHYETKKRRTIPDSVVQDARYHYWVRVRPISEIAKAYGIPTSTMRSILTYENYVDVKDAFTPEQIKRSWD